MYLFICGLLEDFDLECLQSQGRNGDYEPAILVGTFPVMDLVTYIDYSLRLDFHRV